MGVCVEAQGEAGPVGGRGKRFRPHSFPARVRVACPVCVVTIVVEAGASAWRAQVPEPAGVLLSVCS
jgi:hypothetical protein